MEHTTETEYLHHASAFEGRQGGSSVKRKKLIVPTIYLILDIRLC